LNTKNLVKIKYPQGFRKSQGGKNMSGNLKGNSAKPQA
jgi:hypothetical protein